MDDEVALVADDSQLMCDRLEDELMQLGFSHCIKALNGQEAVKAYKENKVDVTFLDIGMPIMDDLQTLQLIRSINPDAYIIMASGASLVDKVKTSIKLGARGFMVKPYSTEKVREMVRNYRAAISVDS